MKKENKNIKTKKISIDDLVIMTGRGFEDVEGKLSKKIDDIEEKLSRKVDGLSNRIDDLSLNRATREELKILQIRVEKVEKKVFK